MLHYVPCQTIQDRRACNNIQKDCKLLLIGIYIYMRNVMSEYFFLNIIDDDNSFFQLFKEFKFYIGERD